MKITRKSILSGTETTMELNVTEAQLQAFHDGMLLQYAFPNLNDDEREFIKSGITAEEWCRVFGED